MDKVELILAFVPTASAQSLPNKGKLNSWATQLVQRNHDNSAGCLSNVRVAKNNGFDRLVFEFKDEMNSYTVYYLPSNLDTEGEKIKIAGKVFMNIDLYGMPCESENYPEDILKLPMIQQITGGVFEGVLNLIIGIKEDNLYRVQELKNPMRRVIDFKH